MAERSPARERLLSKEVAPYGSMESGHMAMGGVVHPDDPVLVYLSEFRDERAYTNMVRTEQGISSALETRYGSIISAGYSVEPGESGGRHAEELAEWARSYLKSGLRNVDQVQRGILEGVGYGWVPLNLIWGEWRAKGSAWYVPKRAKRKPHHDYRFSFPSHHLVHYWPYGAAPKVFAHRTRGSIDWYRWLTPSYGEVASPYGDALLKYVWTLFSVKRRAFRMLMSGMGRSMGILHAKTAASLGQQQGASEKNTFGELVSDLKRVLEYLASHNILISSHGRELEFLKNIEFSEGWMTVLQYIDQWIQVAIVGEGLTASMGLTSSAGSRSAGEVTERKTQRRSTADARYLEAGMTDLLQRAIEWNHGEVDDDMLPRFTCKLGKKPEHEALTVYLTAGGRVSEGRIADLYGIPVPTDVGLDDVLGEHKPVSENAPMLPFGQEAPALEEGGDDEAQGASEAGPPETDGDDDQGQGAGARQRSASKAEFLREEEILERRLSSARPDAERFVEQIIERLAEPYVEALTDE